MSAPLAVPSPVPIDAELAAEIEKQSAWVSSSVSQLRVAEDGRSVHFHVTGSDAQQQRAKVSRFVSDMVERHRAVPRKVVIRREHAGRMPSPGAFEELLRRGWAVELGRGRVSLRGPALAVVRALDEDVARIARRLGAVEESHPALAPATLLARCGYFTAFPHCASLVTHLVEDYDAIEAFRRRNAEAFPQLVQPAPEAVGPFQECLLPALCYAVYAAWQGTVLPDGGATVTCGGRCFRFESRNLAGAERLWEFGMREIVALGSERTCAGTRVRVLEAVLDQLDRWGLDGTIESANDPFFPAARATRAYWQRSGDRKLELRLHVGPGSGEGGEPQSLACASFNLHERFFGTAFSIAGPDGEPASSGCAGWGLERWMLACFAQHGFEPSRWPSWLAERVFE
jgi:seryl-tRNA synthetase